MTVCWASTQKLKFHQASVQCFQCIVAESQPNERAALAQPGPMPWMIELIESDTKIERLLLFELIRDQETLRNLSVLKHPYRAVVRKGLGRNLKFRDSLGTEACQTCCPFQL